MKRKILNLYFKFIWFLARKYIQKNDVFVLWVTWSIGKTTLRTIVSEILQKRLTDKIIYTSSKNYNWELWLSLSILQISDYSGSIYSIIKTIFKSIIISFFGKKTYDIIFLEYGIDHIWEMDFLLSIVKPNISIITKIDKVHSESFKDTEIIAIEKYKLAISWIDYTFLNFDDKYYPDFLDNILAQKCFYTTNYKEFDEKIDIIWKDYELKKELIWTDNKIYSSFDLFISWDKKLQINSNITQVENIGYISLWYKILDLLFQKYYQKSFFDNKTTEEINFNLQYGRFSIFNWIEDNILIDSTYNASPLSMKTVIENWKNIRDLLFLDYKIILCIWDMRELWEYTIKEHEDLWILAKQITDVVFMVWESTKNYTYPMFYEYSYLNWNWVSRELAKEFIKKEDVNLIWWNMFHEDINHRKLVYSKKSWETIQATQANENIRNYKCSNVLWRDLREYLIKNKHTKHIIIFKWSQNTIFMEESIKFVLKNHLDSSNLCRQEYFWIKRKKEFFNKNNCAFIK